MEWNHGHGVLQSTHCKGVQLVLGSYIGWISNRLDRHISKLTPIFEGHQPPILEWQLGRSASGRHFVCAQPNYGIALQDISAPNRSPVCSISLPTLVMWTLAIIFVYGNVNINFPCFFLDNWPANNLKPPGICSINRCRGAGRWQKRVDIVGCQSAELRWHLRWDIHLATDDWYILLPSRWFFVTRKNMEECLRCGFTNKHVGMGQYL